MVKINYAELHFDHAVMFNEEEAVFVAARENGSGKTRIFLVFSRDRVYTRNGRAESWELLSDNEARDILNRIYSAINEGITLYTLNGPSQAVTGYPIPAN